MNNDQFKPKSIDVNTISMLMIAESYPEQEQDYFYSSKDSLYVLNTISAFQQAGFKVESIDEILAMGVCLTSAVKEPRPGVNMPRDLILKHSPALEEEIFQFPNLKILMLMGDTAIKAVKHISRQRMGKACIPTGSTYKIRAGEFFFGELRVFPSYLQTGKNFLIEKSKQRMVADDIQRAFTWLKLGT